MWNLFTDLKNMGVKGLNENMLFDMEKENTNNDHDIKQQKALNVHIEGEFLFDKKYQCPVCGKDFTSKSVKTGKARLINSDSDLKPNYTGIEPLKYDVIVCCHCGYASLVRNFGHITAVQSKLVKENISVNFKGIKKSGESYYTFEEAEERYKLALANAIVMKIKNSERAYLCLKLGWLYRYEGKQEKEKGGHLSVINDLKEKEISCIKMAYEGFTISYTKELPPICGMDSNVLAYLLSDLARQCKDYENAMKYVGTVLTSRVANERIKSRAREEKELLFKEMKKEE